MAPAAAADPPFGVTSFSNRTVGPSEAPYTAAGGHPFQSITEFSVSLRSGGTLPVENLNGTYVTLPPGFVANPAAAPRCPIANLRLGSDEEDDSTCPPGSQVGVAVYTIDSQGNGPSTPSRPLYNLVPERGYLAQFGFIVEAGVPMAISVFPQPRTESYGLSIGTPNIPAIGVTFLRSTFFGTPFQHGSGSTPAPFLSNPVDCASADPTWRIAIDSQEHAGALRELGVPDLTDPDWKTASDIAPPVTGCDDPLLVAQFDPGIATTPLQGGGATQADQPAGLAVDVDFPQSNDPTDPNTEFDPNVPQAPAPKDITLKLPAGLAISPAAADGLGACSDQASGPAGDQVHYDNTKPVTCPDSAKIGSATATSPLLATHDPVTDAVDGAEPIPGDVYLLAPHPGDLPIGGGSRDGRFRLLVQLENERYGVNFKLPGIATADRETGRLTMAFADAPQLPVRHLTVNLFPGPRAALATPVTCGNFTTSASFVPWSTPGTPDANKATSFDVGSGPNGSGCVTTPGQRPFAPALVAAGTENDLAGASSPFTLRLTRNDGEGEFSSLEATLPKGLAAKFAGIPYCPDAALAAAATRAGKAEQASPTCPASRIGSVAVGAGPGTNPFNASGTAHLAGPYKGAPMSVAVIIPAVADPFDLGTVVVRNALHVDPETAQGRVVSDPFPQILDGIPLKLRSILVRLDRPSFTLNPTSCEAKPVTATLTSTDGAVANPANRFQARDCDKLGFKPKLALHLLDGLARNRHPALRAVLRAGPGEGAIAAATVTLPAGELLDLRRLPALCARGLPPERCPPASRLGRARVRSPLLAKPLEGPIYMRAPSGQFPDLLADLRGAGLHFVLHGRISAPSRRLRIHFPDIPDIPLTKAQLTFAGGPRGLIVNSEALCGRSRRATVGFRAHNGNLIRLRPLLRLRGRC